MGGRDTQAHHPRRRGIGISVIAELPPPVVDAGNADAFGGAERGDREAGGVQLPDHAAPVLGAAFGPPNAADGRRRFFLKILHRRSIPPIRARGEEGAPATFTLQKVTERRGQKHVMSGR